MHADRVFPGDGPRAPGPSGGPAGEPRTGQPERPAAYASFALAPAVRTGGVLPGGAYDAHREFLDFVVDGRPLLLRLDDVDGVSPLAADLGPTVFTTHVRRLLLETEPPLPDGRYVLYGCPECEGLDCGAVTAVLEQDGQDVIWRDFAWQTDVVADPVRDGYPGVGPFRFRGDEYRSALREVLDKGAPDAAPRRVLLVGARAAVLAQLAKALRQMGIAAETTHDAAGALPEELRGYDAVAFGRGIPEEDRQAVRAACAAAGSRAVFVSGLAPVVPVLAAQIEQALDRGGFAQRQLADLTATDGKVTVELGAACRVRITAYRLDRFNRTHAHELLDAPLDAGTHTLALDGKAARGQAFVVARTTSGVRVTATPAPG